MYNRWAIKNSSLMLFSSIMLRMVGTNKFQQNLNNESKSNYNFSFSQFFNLYPSLYNYLLNYFNEIKKYNKQNDLSIYPLILLLSHLKHDCLDNINQKYSSLDYFKGITSIGNSKNEMIRIMTSKSLVYYYYYYYRHHYYLNQIFILFSQYYFKIYINPSKRIIQIIFMDYYYKYMNVFIIVLIIIYIIRIIRLIIICYILLEI